MSDDGWLAASLITLCVIAILIGVAIIVDCWRTRPWKDRS